jgi:hypothetical protein
MGEIVADAVLSSDEVPRRIGGWFTAEMIPDGLSTIAHSAKVPGAFAGRERGAFFAEIENKYL